MKYLSHAYSQASGKIGGSVYSHARGTLIVRAYRKPVNPNTSFQQVVRNGLGALQTAFRTTLTSAQRAAWAVFAQNMTYVDVLGNSTHLTAQQWYVSLNNPRLQASVARVDPGPTIYAADYLTAPVPTIVAAGTTASIAYTNTDAWANEAGGYLLVYASRPQNSTKNFFVGPYRFAGKVTGAATPPTSPAVITLPFVIGPVGSKVFFRFISVRADARTSPSFRVVATA